MSPDGRQDIIRTNVRILLIEPLGINFNEILVCIQTFTFQEMDLNMSTAQWRTFCPGRDEFDGGEPPAGTIVTTRLYVTLPYVTSGFQSSLFRNAKCPTKSHEISQQFR